MVREPPADRPASIAAAEAAVAARAPDPPLNPKAQALAATADDPTALRTAAVEAAGGAGV